MAFCPKCNGEMPATAIECPHCHYDFPTPERVISVQQDGFAFSPLADLALMVSSVAAAAGCLGTLYASAILLFSGQIFMGLVAGPIAFFLQLGMLVVFLRVQR